MVWGWGVCVRLKAEETQWLNACYVSIATPTVICFSLSSFEVQSLMVQSKEEVRKMCDRST